MSCCFKFGLSIFCYFYLWFFSKYLDILNENCSNVFSIFQTFCWEIITQFGTRIKIFQSFQSDNAHEYCLHPFNLFDFIGYPPLDFMNAYSSTKWCLRKKEPTLRRNSSCHAPLQLCTLLILGRCNPRSLLLNQSHVPSFLTTSYHIPFCFPKTYLLAT